MIFSASFMAGLGDVGLGGKLTNKCIMKMFEDAAGFHSDSVSDGINQLDTKKNAWILMAWRIHIVERPCYGMKYTVDTWSRSMERAHAFRDFRLKAPDGRVLAVASSKWSLISTETRKLLRLTPEISQRYGTVPDCVFDNWTPTKPHVPEFSDVGFAYRVLRRDTDIMKHMHNLYYLDLAYEALPEEIYSSEEFNDIEIIYRSEITLGDDVSVHYYNDNGYHTAAIMGKCGLCSLIRLW